MGRFLMVSQGPLGPSGRRPASKPDPAGRTESALGLSRACPRGAAQSVAHPAPRILNPSSLLVHGPPGGLLGPSWGPPGGPGLLVSSWGLLGPPGRLWGPPGNVLGGSLGTSWGLLGASWEPPGRSWGPPGGTWVLNPTALAQNRDFYNVFKVVRGPPRTVLGPKSDGAGAE